MYFSIRDGTSSRRDDEVLWRKDGSPVNVEYSSVPLRNNQEIMGAVVIFRDITARRLAEQKIKNLAFHDPLTGLSNRVLLTQNLEQAMAGMGRGTRGFALHMLDLDHFKDVNDSLGHPIGDALLKAVAQRISRIIRGDDTFARFGGDEFALLQTRVQSYSDASVTAAKILGELGREFVLEGNSIHTNASIGIVMPDKGRTTPDELIRKADVALYKAKESGRGTFAFFEDAMNRQLQREIKLSLEVMQALEREEFTVLYQPQFDLGDDRLLGLEALVRWRHPQLGLLLPGDFLGVAEKRGLIQRISDWVFAQACRQSRIWAERGLRFGRIAVNVCAQQLADQSFGENMLSILRQASADPRHLALELTETSMINADVRTQADVIHLSECGIQFAIDDFGTGFSSLQYLRQFKADKLKIDRQFIRDVETDSDDAEIVKATIALGSALNMTTVAEGVETAGQVDFLRQNGCNQAQGFLYGRPDTVENVERQWLDNAEVEKSEP
jgi:diguanylate cyclase (GGDEF)-like protein